MAKASSTATAPGHVVTFETAYQGKVVAGSLGEPQELINPDPDGDGVAYNGKPIYTVEEAAAQLNREGAIWPISGNGTITYSFAEHAPGGQYNNKHVGIGDYVDGFEAFTPEQRDAAREAIALWDDLVAVDFVETNGAGADIVYMNTSTGPAQAAAYTPFLGGGHGRFEKIQGDTYVNQDQPDNFDLSPGGYGFTTLVHETGHAIGLEHPGDYNFAVGGTITYAHDAEYFQDSYQFSIMSYFNAGNTGTKGYVIIMQDTDILRQGMPILHWTIANIPATVTRLDAGMTAPPAGAAYGPNIRGANQPYMGPRTPPGPKHRYHFQIFAMDLDIAPEALSSFATLTAAMKDHVLASGEIIGLGSAPPPSGR